MFDDIKSLLKHGSIYTIGILLNRAVAFIMLPIYTRLLAPSEYGTLELLTLTTDLVSTIAGLGMTTAVMRYYYLYDDISQKNRSVSTAIIGNSMLFGLASIICFSFSGSVSSLVFESQEYAPHFRIAFVSMFLSGSLEIPMIFIRAKQQSARFIIINLASLLLQLSLNIYFLVGLRLGVMGILYSTLISKFIFCSILVALTFRETGVGFDFGMYRSMLGYSVPLLFSGLSMFALTFSDRYFVEHYRDLTQVGLYSLAYKLGMLVSNLFTSPFVQIWSAKMFEIAKKEQGARTISKIMTYFVLAILTISLALSLLARDLLRVIADPSYLSAFQLVPLISFSYAIMGAYYIASCGILIKNKTKYRGISTVVAMFVNIGLNFLLIPVWGGLGAALSTLISFGVRFAIEYYYSQRYYPIKYEYGRILLMLGLYVPLNLPVFFLRIDNRLLSIAAFGGIALLFPLFCYALGVLDKNEKEFVRRLLRNPIGALKILKNGLTEGGKS